MRGRARGAGRNRVTGVNKQIFSLLGEIGASPYMAEGMRLNSQYARIETLFAQGGYPGCVAACSALFGELMAGLHLAVTGDTAGLSVILSDIAFWDAVGDGHFRETAEMLQYACCRLREDPDGEPEKAARLAKAGVDDVIGCAARFLAERAGSRCLDPVVLRRADVREPVNRLTDSLRARLEGAGISDGFSMQPPHMNAGLLDFPERETALWAGYLAGRLRRIGLLTVSELRTLDAERVVDERVGLTNEYIRRAAEAANGGALLIEHFEEFDMPCLGGNLLDRALRTVILAADKYRGSLCIVVAGRGEALERAFRRAEGGLERFPLLLSLRQ